MSDGAQAEPQIPMICATGALKTGPVRIGHIAGDITLPRTVALPTLIAVCVGAFLGLIAALIAPGGGLQKYVLAVVFGGFIGYMITSYSPLRGESMLTWAGLQMNTLRRQRRVRGEPVVVAVGVAAVPRETLGRFRMERSAVRVAPGRFDDRGVVISVKNHNVPAGAHVFGNHVYTVAGEPPLTPTTQPQGQPLDAAAPAHRVQVPGGEPTPGVDPAATGRRMEPRPGGRRVRRSADAAETLDRPRRPDRPTGAAPSPAHGDPSPPAGAPGHPGNGTGDDQPQPPRWARRTP